MDTPSPPLIIIGTHRSGTTMLAGLLARSGVYIGRRLGRNNEALYFRRLNRWLLAQGGGSWTRPLPFADILDDPPSRELAADYLRASLTFPRTLGFWGWRNLVKRGEGLWGWKDPRTTFTLPLWLELFPEARVINVERHGVDVAESLVVRRERSLARSRRRFHKRRALFRFLPKRGELVDTPRLARREPALQLWTEYMAEGRRQVEQLGNRALTISYEDLLRSPEQELERLAEFCGLALDRAPRRELTASLDSGRAFAYREDPELRRFAADQSQLLETFGYGP
ncbi:sulfotransferase [Thiohalorhabdus sp.]|uniref:sulfotransferase n=1 Tax=Thiohalorhabdus sp. TaxID=3094134 RepID=UPI002FC2C034